MIDLYAPGAYCRTAGGNLERPSDQAQTVRWMAWSINADNGMNGDPAAWTRCRQLWGEAGIAHFPWLHCRSLADVERLIAVGTQFSSPAIGLNIEDVTRDGLSLQQVGGLVRDFWFEAFGKPVHMATLPWVQNGQGWQHLSFCVAALEFFPDEQGIWPGRVYSETIAAQCFQHAGDEGLTQVTAMLKTRNYVPSSYGTSFSPTCHSLYTADDITPSAAGWKMWQSPDPCVKPNPPAPPPAMLTEKQYPYTGPFYGPSAPKGPTKNRPTVKGIKRGMIRLGYLKQELGKETDDFGIALEGALREFQRDVGVTPGGQYGRGTWLALRRAKLTSGPNAGKWAMDARALAYVREDAIALCHPIEKGAAVTICQGLHQTLGLNGNWAIDFCCAPGSKVLAVERAVVKKLSGHDPAQGVLPGGIFGWSIHYETPTGYRYFTTHYGTRTVHVGQIVDVGDVIGTIGNWPGNAHLHQGVTSPLGSADAKKKITAVSQAVRL